MSPARITRIIPQTARIGAFRQRADIKRPSTTIGARGQITGDDVMLCRAWPCEVLTLGGQELIEARQLYPTASHVVRGWWRQSESITVRHRLTWQGRTLNIGHVRVLANQRGLVELLCAEAV